MDTPAPPVGGIVVGLDGSSSSHEAFGWAADQAALERRPLVLAHAVPALRLPDPSLHGYAGVDVTATTDQLRGVATALLRDVASLAETRHPGLEVHQALSTDDPRSTLLDLADRAAMVVVGSRGRGRVGGLVLGSVSSAVAQRAACPVVVFRPADPVSQRYGVLVGVATDHADHALELAFDIAAVRGFPLTVLHLWTRDLPRQESILAASIAAVADKHPEVHLSVRRALGEAERHLVTATRNYDLVVVGHQISAGLGRLSHRSVAHAVLEHAHGPVAVVSSLSHLDACVSGV